MEDVCFVTVIFLLLSLLKLLSVLWAELFLPSKSCVVILTHSTSEHDCVWRQGL